MDPSVGGWNVHLGVTNRTSYYRNHEDETNRIISLRSPAGYSLTETILICAVLLFIIVGTIVGNILVCTAVCLVRRLRRPCNYLLVSLAVSDLCVAILVMPMALVYEVLGTWPFGARACDTWVAFDVLSCTASILNLCMISVDRYWAITRPLDYGVKRTPGRMIFCVALVWISSACISLPPLLVLGNEHGPTFPPANNSSSSAMDGQDYQCQVCQEFGYQIYATLGSFYMPLAVMAAVYYQIFQAAKRIVDEEKKAQSHLLLTRTNSCAKQKTATTATGQNDAAKTVQSSLLVHPYIQSTSAAAVVVVRRQSEEKIKTRNVLSATTNSTAPQLANDDGSWSSSICRPTTWPDNSLKQQHPQTADISRNSLAVSMDSVTESDGHGRFSRHAPVAFNHPIEKQPIQSGAVLLPVTNRRKRSSNRLPNGRTSRVRLRFALNKERKASTTLGIIMSAFTLCWFPFFVLALVRPFMSHQTASLVIPHWLSSLFLWLGYANSFLNPVIYATTNKDFRLPFREILCLRCKSLNSVMREDFYQSQYGNNQQPGKAVAANNNKTGSMASASPSSHHKNRKSYSTESFCAQQRDAAINSCRVDDPAGDEETDYGLGGHRTSSSSATAFL